MENLINFVRTKNTNVCGNDILTFTCDNYTISVDVDDVYLQAIVNVFKKKTSPNIPEITILCDENINSTTEYETIYTIAKINNNYMVINDVEIEDGKITSFINYETKYEIKTIVYYGDKDFDIVKRLNKNCDYCGY